jgi:hypothetical protein
MDAQLLKFSLPPTLLQRGFWLYASKIRGPNDKTLCYVGMTGDVNGVAQSPFARAIMLHLTNLSGCAMFILRHGEHPDGRAEIHQADDSRSVR